MVIFASNSSLPVYLNMDEARAAVEKGAAILYESPAGSRGCVVFAVTDDMILLPVFAAKGRLKAEGWRCASSP